MGKMKRNISKNKGFIQLVILAIVIIATLAYFKIDLRTLLNRPELQKVWGIFVSAWTLYIKPLFWFLFTSISGLFVK